MYEPGPGPDAVCMYVCIHMCINQSSLVYIKIIIAYAAFIMMMREEQQQHVYLSSKQTINMLVHFHFHFHSHSLI